MKTSQGSSKNIRKLVSRIARQISSQVANERGDVPGWVLVTVMTAGLVVGLWTVADGQLTSVLTNALHSVSTP